MDPTAARRSGRFASLVVGMAAAASRLLGFARDVGLAMLFGAGPVSDALLIALRLPNLVRRVLSEGGLHTAFVPVLLSLPEHHGQVRQHFAGQVLAGLAMLGAVLGVGVQLFALPLVVLLGAPLASADMAAQCLVLAFPMVIGSGFAAIGSALMASRNQFALAAWSGVLVNGIVVAGLGWFVLFPVEEGLAARWLAGLSGLAGLVQGVVLLVVVQKTDRPPLWSWPRQAPALTRFARLSLPNMLIAAASPLAFLLVVSQAGAQSGVVSQLYFADRVTQLPFGFIAAALAIVALPAISRHAHNKDRTAFARSIDQALRLSLLLAVPAAGGLIMLADPISHVLFEHGAFDHAAQQATRAALSGFALALPALAVGRVSAQGFFAHHRTVEPLLATVAGLGAVLALCLVMAHVAQPQAGEYALVLSGGAGIEMLLGLGFLLGRLGWRPRLRLLADLVLIGLATAFMLSGLAALSELVAPLAAQQPSFRLELVLVLGQCLGGMTLYGLCIWLFGLFKPDERPQQP